jgi:peptidoglycan/LPS O-acetylase OafA/YrhL
MNLKWWHYLRRLLPIVLATVGVAIASYAIALLLPTITLSILLLIGFLISCIYLIITYRLGLSGDEKEIIIEIIEKIMSGLPRLNHDPS